MLLFTIHKICIIFIPIKFLIIKKIKSNRKWIKIHVKIDNLQNIEIIVCSKKNYLGTNVMKMFSLVKIFLNNFA